MAYLALITVYVATRSVVQGTAFRVQECRSASASAVDPDFVEAQEAWSTRTGTHDGDGEAVECLQMGMAVEAVVQCRAARQTDRMREYGALRP